MQAWYMQTFGASPVTSANPAAFISAGLPRLTLNFASPMPVVGTQGRALDHIGFEVTNLEAFTRKLEAQGDQARRPTGKCQPSASRSRS